MNDSEIDYAQIFFNENQIQNSKVLLNNSINPDFDKKNSNRALLLKAKRIRAKCKFSRKGNNDIYIQETNFENLNSSETNKSLNHNLKEIKKIQKRESAALSREKKKSELDSLKLINYKLNLELIEIKERIEKEACNHCCSRLLHRNESSSNYTIIGNMVHRTKSLGVLSSLLIIICIFALFSPELNNNAQILEKNINHRRLFANGTFNSTTCYMDNISNSDYQNDVIPLIHDFLLMNLSNQYSGEKIEKLDNYYDFFKIDLERVLLNIKNNNNLNKTKNIKEKSEKTQILTEKFLIDKESKSNNISERKSTNGKDIYAKSGGIVVKSARKEDVNVSFIILRDQDFDELNLLIKEDVDYKKQLNHYLVGNNKLI